MSHGGETRRKRIAIACQGGGSQCAFIAGALGTLIARDVHHRFKLVGLSGTSGGALTAALAWSGLLLHPQDDDGAIEKGILACWKDLTAQTPQEIALDRMCIQSLRLADRGLLPTIASSPSSLQFRFWSQLAALMVGRPEFTDLRALLLKHLDFELLASLVGPDSPVLLVGACDVLQGNFKVFSSVNREIQVEALLASAAVPNLFPAVQIDGHAYWDGIFSANPPITSFFRKALMGDNTEMRPEEIWILQVNPSRHDSIPECSADIVDRRNHLAGNLSMQHELELLEVMNMLLREGALTEEFRARLGLDATTGVTVRFIRMSDELRQRLDYPSKLSREPGHIARLIADGTAQAIAFLSDLDGPEHPSQADAEETAVQIH